MTSIIYSRCFGEVREIFAFPSEPLARATRGSHRAATTEARGQVGKIDCRRTKISGQRMNGQTAPRNWVERQLCVDIRQSAATQMPTDRVRPGAGITLFPSDVRSWLECGRCLPFAFVRMKPLALARRRRRRRLRFSGQRLVRKRRSRLMFVIQKDADRWSGRQKRFRRIRGLCRNLYCTIQRAFADPIRQKNVR